jgi:F-type H+-transporting ATPase subunit b
VSFITPSFAQDGHGEAGAGELHEGAEAPGGAEHETFPPFDPATWGSQLVWLAITFGVLLFLMSRLVLPRIKAILDNRSERISGDLAAAGRLKDETDAAIAAYEQALAEARQNAHSIAQEARDAAKGKIDADRGRIEAKLQEKLDAADARINEEKTQALAEVDAIAREATEAMVEVLIGESGGADVAPAVEAAMAERAGTR